MRDRLLRFGVELIRFLCTRMKTEFRVIEAPEDVSFELELARDVTTLMTRSALAGMGKDPIAKKKNGWQ